MASEAVTEAHDCKSFGDGYDGGARGRKGERRGVTRQCRWEVRQLARHQRGSLTCGGAQLHVVASWRTTVI
ncbi:hypothetical protein SESBI_01278 [Sesbania bispinosa]|nr:hypothetical protein SESBI_01278 [Sesbania bispinosa]